MSSAGIPISISLFGITITLPAAGGGGGGGGGGGAPPLDPGERSLRIIPLRSKSIGVGVVSCFGNIPKGAGGGAGGGGGAPSSEVCAGGEGSFGIGIVDVVLCGGDLG